MQNENTKTAMRVSLNTIIANIVLSAFKLAAGIFAGSAAMLSDAVHSLSDVASTIVVMVGIKLSGRQSDKDHPYGHERLECAAAIVLASMLGVTGILIGWNGVQKIISGYDGVLTVPGGLALVAAVVSIVVKEAMYWYTRSAAKKINSGALMADAWHHRSDALSSIGSFAGVLGARLGLPVLDPIASVVICLFILKVSYRVFKDAIGKMTDKAIDDETVEALRELILRQETVLRVDALKTRLFGDRFYVDVEIGVNGDIALVDAHQAAQQVHDEIEAEFPKVKHCMVHVNPVGFTCRGENDNVCSPGL